MTSGLMWTESAGKSIDLTEWVPYGRQTIGEDDIAAVAAAMRAGWVTTGPSVTDFEEALQEVTGARHAVVVSSGTAALHAAYAALSGLKGREVICSPLTFVSTIATAIQVGARAVFADVQDETLNLDPDRVSAAVTPDTAVIATTDFAGVPSAYEELGDVAAGCNAVLLADAAHSLGGRWQGKAVGTLAGMTTLSFHAVKVITTGEGGAVVTDDAEWADRARRFRDHGMFRGAETGHDELWYQVSRDLGLNYRMTELQAALGVSQLKKLAEFLELRSRIAERYSAALCGVEEIMLPTVPSGAESAWHIYPVRILDGRRRAVFEHMRARGIGVQVHYVPAHWHPAIQAHLGFQPSLPVAERAYSELISLPMFPELRSEQQTMVIDVLLEALER